MNKDYDDRDLLRAEQWARTHVGAVQAHSPAFTGGGFTGGAGNHNAMESVYAPLVIGEMYDIGMDGYSDRECLLQPDEHLPRYSTVVALSVDYVFMIWPDKRVPAMMRRAEYEALVNAERWRRRRKDVQEAVQEAVAESQDPFKVETVE